MPYGLQVFNSSGVKIVDTSLQAARLVQYGPITPNSNSYVFPTSGGSIPDGGGTLQIIIMRIDNSNSYTTTPINITISQANNNFTVLNENGTPLYYWAFRAR